MQFKSLENSSKCFKFYYKTPLMHIQFPQSISELQTKSNSHFPRCFHIHMHLQFNFQFFIKFLIFFRFLFISEMLFWLKYGILQMYLIFNHIKGTLDCISMWICGEKRNSQCIWMEADSLTVSLLYFPQWHSKMQFSAYFSRSFPILPIKWNTFVMKYWV